MSPDIGLLRTELVRDEGLRLKPYIDTAGKLTIGVGRNLGDRGIAHDEALLLLDNDIRAACSDLDRNAPWWRGLSEGRQRALLNMTFNLGWPRISAFKGMLAALQSGQYLRAADEALDSAWARQVGARAARIAALIRRG